MSGNVYTVRAGSAQQLTGAPVTKGATVWNIDLANSVWISSDTNCQPNYGIELQPQMSVDWIGGQLFACLDNQDPNATPVQLEISNDVTNISNPVGIAAAIALQGIPNVLLTDIIVPTITLVPGGSAGTLLLGKYASIEVYAFEPSGVGDLSIEVRQALNAGPSGTTTTDQMFLTQVAPNGTNAPTGSFVPAVSAVAPVTGQQLKVINKSATSSVTVAVLGSNRTVPSPRRVLPGNATAPRELVNPTGTGAGIRSFLKAAEGSSADDPDWTSFNGQCTLAVLTNAYNGSLNYIYQDILGGIHTVPVLTMVPATTSYVLEIPHPFVNTNWAINSTSPTAANSIAMFITPNNYN